MRQKFGVNKKYNIGVPRDTVMAYEAVMSKVSSNSATQFMNAKFVDNVDRLRKENEELQRSYDEYYAAVEFEDQNPGFLIPYRYFMKPNKDSVKRLEMSLQKYNDALKLQKESTASCGIVLEFIKSFIGDAVSATLHSVFHENDLPNNVQVEKVLEFFLDHGLGTSVDVKETIESDLRAHTKAKDLREVKIMFDNLKILRSELQSYNQLIKKSKDLHTMSTSSNPALVLLKEGFDVLNDKEFALLLKSKIEQTNANVLLLAAINILPEAPTLLQISIVIERYTKNIVLQPPVIQQSVDIPINALVNDTNFYRGREEVGTCNFWNGNSCSSKFSPCRFRHIPGKDTRKNFSTDNKYRDRSRSRDRSPSSIERFDSRSRDRSPSSNGFGNRAKNSSPSIDNTYYKDRGNRGSPNSKSFYVESVENKLNQAQNELAMYKNSPIHNFSTMKSFVPMQNFHTVQQPSPVQMFPFSSYQQPFEHMSQPSDNLRPGTPSIQK